MSDENVEYQKLMQAKLDEWNARIDQLKARAEQVEAQARLEYRHDIDHLIEKRDFARAMLRNFSNANSEAARAMKAGMIKAWEDLGAAINAAHQKYQ